MSKQLKADIISFNYRGYGLSDGPNPKDEAIIHYDIAAIGDFFKQTAQPD